MPENYFDNLETLCMAAESWFHPSPCDEDGPLLSPHNVGTVMRMFETLHRMERPERQIQTSNIFAGLFAWCVLHAESQAAG